ncbi:MAG: NAD(P)/FAD-dependent oxidoreductase [Thermoproteota archaeon]|nr:FAD-dependent oxidoreductase [Candidatus Brockarchaeota archaeon]
MYSYDLVVVGGGASGIAASIKAKELGIKKVALIDEKNYLGGVLPQCIHSGFGLVYFKEDLTGPEFTEKLAQKVMETDLDIYTSTFVSKIAYRDYFEKLVYAVSKHGIKKFKTKTIIYSTGCRERNIYEIGILGNRPSGVFTAGEAQTLMDIYGVMPGREIVIVGSGDIGLIMARRFALQGANVKAVVEIMPYPGGLTRNIVQCLNDFNIPLLLNHSVLRVIGKNRVEEVEVCKLDENRKCIEGSKFRIKCDTLVISAGLVPRVELLEDLGVTIDPITKSAVVNDRLETSLPGVFVAGNSLVVNDLVDYAVEQGEMAAQGASEFIFNKGINAVLWKKVKLNGNIRFFIPQLISGEKAVTMYGRVLTPEENVKLKVSEINKEIPFVRVRPSEMIRLKLSKDELSSARGESLTFSIFKRGAQLGE